MRHDTKTFCISYTEPDWETRRVAAIWTWIYPEGDRDYINVIHIVSPNDSITADGTDMDLVREGGLNFKDLDIILRSAVCDMLGYDEDDEDYDALWDSITFYDTNYGPRYENYLRTGSYAA